VSTASKAPQSPWRLRSVGAEARDTLTAIHEECFANYWNTSDFNDFFTVPGTSALLCETEGGQPAAMAVLRVQHEQADIITIAVRPPFRRQGLARALMLQSIENARALGATTLFLDVESDNAAALSLYHALGFTQVSRRKLYYRQKNGTYTDALVMTVKLA
jgi:ribosomal-protein-alanine N-acetyltransferase